MLQSHHQTYVNNPDWNMLESSDSLLRVEPNRQEWQGFGDSRMLSSGILLGRGDEQKLQSLQCILNVISGSTLSWMPVIA